MTEDSKSCCGGGKDESSQSHKDPVCGMTVEPKSAKAQVEHLGRQYYFCYVGCADKFKADPEMYLNPNRKKEMPKDAPSGSGYTCPMHPEIVSDKPADCPLCGMSLEPMMPGADDSADAEVAEIKKHLAYSALLTVPLVVLSMSHMLGITALHALSPTANNWLQFALATPVVLWVAQPFIHRGWQSVKNKALNMFTLLSLGIVIPYVYSVASLLTTQMLYFESAAVITTLAWFGQLLEAKARVQSASAVKELVSLMPSEATVVLPDGSPLVMKINEIPVGAEVRVKPGERIPVDGVVLEGESHVDESMLTGEPAAVLKTSGSLVSAGTINSNGSLLVEVKHVGNDTLLAQIINLVAQAQRSKLPVQKLVDKVASVFVPVVVVVALLTFAIWLLNGMAVVQAMTMAVAVLVIACPCALGLATPMSVIVAAGRAAKAGVLFKDASSLEALSQINTLVIDKTGTLTEGKMGLVSVVPAGTLNEDELLTLAASVESHSEHPLAKAVLAANAKRKGATLACKDFAATPGEGVSGKVDGRVITLGTKSFAGGNTQFDNSNGSEIYISIDGQCQGRLEFADKLRADAVKSIKELQRSGITVVLATGDKAETAQAIADAVGIKDVRAALLPADKAALVKELQAKGAVVAMAGDGINDAPALAQANIGIAMASGTGIAISSAGIVLLNSDISGIVRAHKISKAMLSNIAENLFLAFGYNVLAIPAAAGVLLPILGIALNPMIAAAAMSVSSVSVIANALRLRYLKL